MFIRLFALLWLGLTVRLQATVVTLTFDITVNNVHDYVTGTDTAQVFPAIATADFDTAIRGFGPVPTAPSEIYGRASIQSSLTGGLFYGSSAIRTGNGFVILVHPMFTTTDSFNISESQTDPGAAGSQWTYSIFFSSMFAEVPPFLDVLPLLDTLQNSGTAFSFSEGTWQRDLSTGANLSGFRYDGTAVIRAIATPEPESAILSVLGLLAVAARGIGPVFRLSMTSWVMRGLGVSASGIQENRRPARKLGDAGTIAAAMERA